MTNVELGGTLKKDYPSLSMQFYLQLAEFCKIYPMRDYFPLLSEVCKIDWKNSKPSIRHFYESAKAMGITPVKTAKFTANRCFKCGTIYSEVSRGCPVCHEMTPYSVVNSEQPIIVTPIREHCFDCKVDYTTAPGPTCEHYGKHADLS